MPQHDKPGRYGPHGSSLRDLPRLRTSRRKRASSWDRTGGNDDRLMIEPGQTVSLADDSVLSSGGKATVASYLC